MELQNLKNMVEPPDEARGLEAAGGGQEDEDLFEDACEEVEEGTSYCGLPGSGLPDLVPEGEQFGTVLATHTVPVL